MSNRLRQYRDFLVRKQTELEIIKKDLDVAIKERGAGEKILANTERARDIINDVVILTQERVKGLIEEVVTLALSAVYGNDYEFGIEYQIKRNQHEATLWLVKDGDRFSLKDEVGGGVCDICSFALRLIMWAISPQRTSPVFIFDEPGRFLSRDLQPLFGQMIKQVSSLLGVQIIMVSHSPDLIEASDRAYEVTQVKGISTVQLIKGD